MRHSYRRAIGIPFSIVFEVFNEYFSRLRQSGRGAERAIGFTFCTCSTTAALPPGELYTPCCALEVGAGGRPGRLGWVSFLGGLWWNERVAILVYIRIRYNAPTRIKYIQTFIRQIKAKQTKVQHLIQEYCTSLKAGILYNRENRNFVQHRKQEYCTSLND